MSDTVDSRRQELLDQLGSQIDRATFAAVKAAYHNIDDIQAIVRVSPTIKLEEVGLIFIADEVEELKGLLDSRLVHFLAPDSHKKQVTTVSFSEIPDARSLRVLLVAPYYLIQEDARKPERPRMEGKRICKECKQEYEVDEEDHHMAPPWAYADGCDEYCLRCWLLGGPDEE